MTFFYQNHFNLFTDTSDRKMQTKQGEIKATCPGFIATYDGKVLGAGTEIYVDADTLFGEAKGIELAVRWIQNMLSSRWDVSSPFNIFSDNLPVVATICNYINTWIHDAIYERKLPCQFNGYQDKVNWEYVAYNVAYTIFTLNYPIFVYYTPGHVPIYKLPFTKYDEASDKFRKKNRKYHNELGSDRLDKYVVHEMATFNNMVDIMTRNYLNRNYYAVLNDINEAGERLALGSGKIIPPRWPFIQSNVPKLYSLPQEAQIVLPPAH